MFSTIKRGDGDDADPTTPIANSKALASEIKHSTQAAEQATA
jgi:hypothetical protein